MNWIKTLCLVVKGTGQKKPKVRLLSTRKSTRVYHKFPRSSDAKNRSSKVNTGARKSKLLLEGTVDQLEGCKDDTGARKGLRRELCVRIRSDE